VPSHLQLLFPGRLLKYQKARKMICMQNMLMSSPGIRCSDWSLHHHLWNVSVRDSTGICGGETGRLAQEHCVGTRNQGVQENKILPSFQEAMIAAFVTAR